MSREDLDGTERKKFDKDTVVVPDGSTTIITTSDATGTVSLKSLEPPHAVTTPTTSTTTKQQNMTNPILFDKDEDDIKAREPLKQEKKVAIKDTKNELSSSPASLEPTTTVMTTAVQANKIISSLDGKDNRSKKDSLKMQKGVVASSSSSSSSSSVLEPPHAVTTTATAPVRSYSTLQTNGTNQSSSDQRDAQIKASVKEKKSVAAGAETTIPSVSPGAHSDAPHHGTMIFSKEQKRGRNNVEASASAPVSALVYDGHSATPGPGTTYTEINAAQVNYPVNNNNNNNNNNMPVKIRSRPTDPMGPRVVHVPGLAMYERHNNRYDHDHEFWDHCNNGDDDDDDKGVTEAEVNHGGPPDPAFVVPMAELVTENSIKLVPATEEDTTCYGRLGRRGCILLIVSQLILVIVIVVVVVSLVGGDDGSEDKQPPTLALTLAPTHMPTFSLTNVPSFPTSESPSLAPSIFPEPEECEFFLDYIDPILPPPYVAPVCQSQPDSVELVFIGGRCNSQSSSCFSFDSTTSCQDFPENGEIPLLESDETIIVLVVSGQATTLSPGDTFTLQNDGNTLPRLNSIEIHRNISPPYNNATILQRVEFEISCNGQILCFASLGAMSIISYVDPIRGPQLCERAEQMAGVEFGFTVSILRKLPNGETTAFIEAVTIDTDFANPRQSSHLQGVALTTSNRTAVFTLKESVDLFGFTSVSAQISATGTTILGNPCVGPVETFYINVAGYSNIACSTFTVNQTGNSVS